VFKLLLIYSIFLSLLTNPNRNRLEAIRKQVAGRVRIVLHGTNGFADEVTQRCIAGGVSKINVNKLVLEDYNLHLKAHASKLPQTALIDEGVRHVVRMQEHQMDACGSTGKA
jgi:fructose-bisphosphate aldolase class II